MFNFSSSLAFSGKERRGEKEETAAEKNTVDVTYKKKEIVHPMLNNPVNVMLECMSFLLAR